MQTTLRFSIALVLAILSLHSPVLAQSRQAPPGMFKDLDDQIVGKALIIHGKQLFIDDYIIGEMDGAQKTLNQPMKHPDNPLITFDKPWESGGMLNRGSILYDEGENIYKLWYPFWTKIEKTKSGWVQESELGYAVSNDGIAWHKPVVNRKNQTNLVLAPNADNPPSVFKDHADPDASRRYKMLYAAHRDETSKTYSTRAAYSPDGIHWTPEARNPLIPHSDTLNCAFWDARLGRYVAYVRFGPPNTRLISRIESEDFIHWSPKVTVLNKTKLDAPFNTEFYGMGVLNYAGVYIGMLEAYHGETIEPIPDDKLWMDRQNVQLAFSRNGVAWSRVGRSGAIRVEEYHQERNWEQEAEQATFIPYGEYRKDWDWGQVSPYLVPLVVGDEIRIYYAGYAARHWASYHGDNDKSSGIGLATLRLDGFVSVNAGIDAGTLTTKPLVFFGDTLEINANAEGGSLTVEALDAEGKVIEGFGVSDCTPISSNSVRHVVKWKDNTDCHLLQARPIKLRFHLKNAKLYAFEPRIRHNHYLQSYD